MWKRLCDCLRPGAPPGGESYLAVEAIWCLLHQGKYILEKRHLRIGFSKCLEDVFFFAIRAFVGEAGLLGFWFLLLNIFKPEPFG